MRGLHEAWWRSDPNSGMAKLIESFITVQFNALIHLASTSAPANVYSPSWNGPAITNFSAYSEVTALQVLNPALGLSLAGNNSTNGTATGPGAAPSATSSAGGANPSSPHTGAIVGGVIGSLFGLLFVFGLVLLLIRHRHRKRPVLPGEASRRQPSALTIEPFMSEAYTRPPHILPISLVLPNGTITTKFQREVARPWRGRQSEAGFSATGQANSSVSHPADSGSTPPTSRGSTSPTSAGNSSGGRLRTRGRAVTSGVPSLVRELVDGIFAQIDARARDSQERSEGVPPPTYVQ
ncbi:hypothetical protein OF83DRAFT_440885 [Amylostereum chailletii]|nr:hypothetical protein OF83DRAFT_440885 [Amylostereum chailletii]